MDQYTLLVFAYVLVADFTIDKMKDKLQEVCRQKARRIKCLLYNFKEVKFTIARGQAIFLLMNPIPPNAEQPAVASIYL